MLILEKLSKFIFKKVVVLFFIIISYLCFNGFIWIDDVIR